MTGPGRAGAADATLAHIWPTHHENVHFYGTHSVDVDGELAKLDSDGYRPLRTTTATEALRSSRPEPRSWPPSWPWPLTGPAPRGGT